MGLAQAMYVQGEIPDWKAMAGMVPVFARNILAQVGFRAARDLYKDYLSGQGGFTLRPRSMSSTGAPVSGRGRKMVSYQVDKQGRFVAIRSFPLNVLRLGPGPRSAKRTAGAGILRSFQGGFDVQSAALEAMGKATDTLMNNADLKQWETRFRAK